MQVSTSAKVKHLLSLQGFWLLIRKRHRFSSEVQSDGGQPQQLEVLGSSLKSVTMEVSGHARKQMS